MIDKPHFSYEESIEAYDLFTKNIGFDVYKEINGVASQTKEKYDHV
jgi:hypothetical protein